MRLVFGDCEIDRDCFELRRRGRLAKLEPKVFDVLLYLVDRRDRVVTKQEILDALWPGESVSDSVLPRCIAAIRRAVGDTRARQATIATAHGRGYRFIADFAEAKAAPGLSDDRAAAAGERDGTAASPEEALPPDASVEGSVLEAGSDFVGRSERLRRLEAACARTEAGSGGIRFIVGEPGIGKTRLAEELTRRPVARDFQVFFGRCHEGDGAPVYWLWLQVLRDAVASIEDGDRLRSLIGSGASDLAELVPELALRLGDVPQSAGPEGEQARFRLFDSATRFLCALARERPVLLVLDDLHWADASSLGLLRFLAGELGRTRLLVVGTYRDVDVRRGHPLSALLGALARDERCERIPLGGFDDVEIRTFVEGLTTQVPTPSLIEAMREMTEGNPFFLREIVHLLADAGGIGEADGAALDSLRLPQGVRDAIGRRLDVLSLESNEVLRAASVIGRSFRLALLATMVEDTLSAGREELLELLAEALDAGIIEELGRGTYAFGHALTRQTLYEELRAPQRTALHRRAAEALEHHRDPSRGDEELPELAHHFYEAAMGGDVSKSIAYSAAAAEAAHRRHAYDEAVLFYERAVEVAVLESPVDEQRQAELLLALGSETHISGHREQALATLDRAVILARKVEDWNLLARVAIAIRGFGESGSRPADGVIELLHEALDLQPENEARLRSQLLSRIAHASAKTVGERRTLSQHALYLAQASGDFLALRDAWFCRWWATLGPDFVEERLEAAEALTGLADTTGDVHTRLLAYEVAFGFHLIRGDADAIEDALSALERVAGELRQPSFIFMAMTYRTSWLINQGRFEDAEALVERAFAYGDGVVPYAAMTCAGQRYWSRNLRGDVIDHTASADELVGLMQGTLIAASKRDLFVLIMRYSASRDSVTAHAALDQAALKQIDRDDNWFIIIVTIAEIALDVRDRELIEWLYEALSPYQHLVALHDLIRVGRGSVAYTVGLLAVGLGRVDDAVQHFERGIELERNARMAFSQLNSETALAGALLRRAGPGDRERAHDLLQAVRPRLAELKLGKLAPLARWFSEEGPENPFDSATWRHIKAS